jgi:hypothetical protein
MIVTQGGRFAGYGFYVLKGKPIFLWNLVDLKRIKWEGPDVLTPGIKRWSSTSSTIFRHRRNRADELRGQMNKKVCE